MLVKLRKMRTTDDDDETVGAAASSTEARPGWMTILRDNALEWLKVLPEVSLEICKLRSDTDELDAVLV